MKTIKILILATLMMFSGVCVNQMCAQSGEPIDEPCEPPSINCDDCACELELPEDCTETTHWIEVYTTSPNCHAVVEYRVRLCDDDCYAEKCQITIDKITPYLLGCLGCATMDESDLQAAMEQIQLYILSHMYEACGNLTPGYSYDYVLSKPACWKLLVTDLGGGASRTEYVPCNRTNCCVSSYCVDWHTNGTYYIVEDGPTACPTDPPDCETGCDGMNICQ